MTGNYAELRKVWREESAALATDRRLLRDRTHSPESLEEIRQQIGEREFVLAELHSELIKCRRAERPRPSPRPDLSDEAIDSEVAALNHQIDTLRSERSALLAERSRRQLRRSAARKLAQLTPEERAAAASE